MLIGTIIGKKKQIYIKHELEDGINYISFDEVTNDGVKRLNEKQAKELINAIFYTQKTRIGTQDGYEVYVDENVLKRYYKDGKEDFDMFFKNNGTDATSYDLKDKISKIKKEYSSTLKILKIAGFMILVEVSLLNALESVLQDDNSYKIATKLSTTYEPATLETFKKYIYESEGLTDADKANLYNESYLSFVLDNVEQARKIYDFNERMDGISIQIYEPSERPNADGYYTFGTNVIHIKDKYENDEEERKKIEIHEFVHLTQAQHKYSYIEEALAETLTFEYYNVPIDRYLDLVNRVNVLTEIIGPEAIINAGFSYDTTMFENSIRKYLNEEQAKEFSELMKFDDWENVNKTKQNEVHEKVEELLKVMINNKYEQTKNAEEKQRLETFLQQSLYGTAPVRYYFNNKSDYEKGTYIQGESEFEVISGAYTSLTILSKGVPNRIQIDNINYTVDFLKQKLETSPKEMINFLVKKLNWLEIYYAHSAEYEAKKTCSYIFPESGEAQKILFDEDGNQIATCNLKTQEQLISDLLSTLKNSNITSIKGFRGYKNIYNTWQEFLDEFSEYTDCSTHTLYGTIEYDNYKGYLKPNEIRFEKLNKMYMPSYYARNNSNVPNKETKYKFLKTGVSEVLAYEYNGEANYGHTVAVKKVRMLMEVLGPELVLNTIYGNGDEQFEETIKQYLYKNKDKEFLQLMRFDDWKHPERIDGIDKRLDALITELRIEKEKKDRQNGKEVDDLHTDRLFEDINENPTPNRIYFNNKNEKYYDGYQLDIARPQLVESYDKYDKDKILSYGIPTKVTLISNCSQKQLIEYLEDTAFSEFICKQAKLRISPYWDVRYENRDNESTKIKKLEDSTSSETKIYGREEIKKDILEEIKKYDDISIDWGKITWEEFNNISKFIQPGNYIATFYYGDNRRLNINKQTMEYYEEKNIIIPSIYDEFYNTNEEIKEETSEKTR